jgi:hypothetical protein
MNRLETLRRFVLTAGQDDYVGLWQVLRESEAGFPDLDRSLQSVAVIASLALLLQEGLIQIGRLGEGGRLDPTDGSTESVIEWTLQSWNELLPASVGVGDVCWIGLTDAGRKLGLGLAS